jgi:26S proteasome regulatory subunit T4
LVRAERYQDAAEACVKYGASCARADQTHSLAKAYLSAIIALLYDGDGVGAQATFNDVHELPGFDKSEERETAYRLLTAYRAADADKIKYAIEDSSCARFLDIVFSRLARKLPNPKHELGAVATKMGADLPTGDTTDEDAGDDLT